MASQPATDSTTFHPADELRIESIEALKVVFDPLRMRILEAFAAQPRTVKEVAEDLATSPHRLYYHVNMMEEHRLLIVTETRMVSGIQEKHYQVAARHFIIAPHLLMFGSGEGEQGLAILLQSVLDETRRDILRSARREIIDLSRKSPHPDSMMLRRGLARMTPEQASQFHKRMLALLDEFTSIGGEEHTPHDHSYTLAVALYPTSAYDVDSSDEEASLNADE